MAPTYRATARNLIHDASLRLTQPHIVVSFDAPHILVQFYRGGYCRRGVPGDDAIRPVREGRIVVDAVFVVVCKGWSGLLAIERALHYALKDLLGVSPHRYLSMLRLCTAHCLPPLVTFRRQSAFGEVGSAELRPVGSVALRRPLSSIVGFR